MANIKDVAKRAGVAISTVSKYINGGSVRKYNEIAIKEAIESLDYRVNDIARSLKTNKAMTIGILIPSLEAAFFTAIAAHMEDIFHEEGYGIILCDYRNNPNLEKDKLNFLISKRVDGLVIVPHESNNEIGRESAAQNVPVVSIDRPSIGVDSVISDSHKGSKQAVRYLLSNGHKDIALIGGPSDVFTTKLRNDGYIEALKDSGIEPNVEYLRVGDYTISGGYTPMLELLKLEKRPSAVFITNYEMTMGAMLALNENKVAIPDELSIVGFDDIDMVRLVNPPVTVVSQQIKMMGQKAAELLLDRINNKPDKKAVKLELETELIIRNSVKDISY